MQDKIADMIAGYDAAGLPEGEIPVSGIHLALAHQIRQQIGRELLDRTTNYADSEYFVYTDDIREICQLEEDNEKR